MEIVRKVFCNGQFEGLYKLKRDKDNRYVWDYIKDTTGHHGNNDNEHNKFYHPIMNIEKSREYPPGQYNSTSWLLTPMFYFEPGDLNEH